MKRNLTLLTGIVFIITILACGGCNYSKKQNASTEEKGYLVPPEESTEIYIYLKALKIDTIMHLEMYDSKKPSCPVIDNLVTVVYPGDTVIWKKASNSNINRIIAITPLDNATIFRNDILETEPDIWTLYVPEVIKPDTVKYEITFSVPADTNTYTIDPYLEYPPD